MKKVEVDCLAVSEEPVEIVNGFHIIVNTNDKQGHYPDAGKYLVFHPIYDGIYMLFHSDDKQEAVDWAAAQDFDMWSENLL